LNPGDGYPPTRSPGVPLRPLGHPSGTGFYEGSHAGPRCYSPQVMAAAAWSAIGLLAATLFGSLYYLGSRIVALGARLGGRIDQLETKLGGRVDALRARIDALSGRMDLHIDQQTG
jgi:hypothetical protein